MSTSEQKKSSWITGFILGVVFITATGAAVFSTLPAPTIADTVADAISLDRRAFTSSGRGFVYVERYDTNSAPWPQPRKLHYESGSTLSTNGSYSRVVFAATGGRLVFRDCFSGDPINAKWFGAVGSNTSTIDDTAAIKAALDFATNFVHLGGQGSASAHATFGGLKVLIPAGNYFYSQIGWPSDVAIRGEGPQRTTLKRLTGQSGNATYARDGDGQRLDIADLSIDGSWMAGTNVVNTEGHGLYLARTNYSNTVDGWPSIRNVYIYNCPQSGLYVGRYEGSSFAGIGGMRGAQVENSHFFANGEYGIVIDSTDGIYRDCYSYNNGIDGIWVRASAVMNQISGGRSYYNVRHGLYAAGTKFNPVKALSLNGFRADQNGRTDDTGSGIYLTNVWESSLSGIIAFGNTKDGVTVMTSTDVGITGSAVEFDYGVSDYGVQNYGVYISSDSTNIVADLGIGFGHSSNDVYVGNPLTSRARTREPNTIKGNLRIDGTIKAFGKVGLQNSTLTNGPEITLESVTDQPAATMFVKDSGNDRFILAPQAGSNYVNLYVGGFGSGQANSREAWILGDTPQAGTRTNETAKPMYFVPPRGTGSGSAASGYFRFYAPVAGSSGTTLHSTREAARIDGAGTSTASSLLLDDGTSLNRVKISSGGERALYLGTEPSFGGGGGGGDVYSTSNNVLSGSNRITGPLTIIGATTIESANIATQTVGTLVLGTNKIAETNIDTALMRSTAPTFSTSITGGSDAFIQLDEHSSSPSTPSSGNVRIYAKSDGKVYRKDGAGTEAELGGGSSSVQTNTTPFVSPTRFVFEGDSLTSGYNITSNRGWAYYVSNRWMTALGGHWGANYATAGQTVTTMISDYASSVGTLKPASGTNAVLFFWGGINDVQAGDTVSQVASDVTNYWGLAKADGYTVVGFTLTESTNMTAAQRRSVADVNDLIRYWAPQRIDYLVDVGSLLTDVLNTNWNSDGVHWNEQASIVIADHVYTVLHDGSTRQSRVTSARSHPDNVFRDIAILPQASPVTSFAGGGLGFDNDAWASGRGALQVNDGTSDTLAVAVLKSDTPSNGQVPKFNTGGTITWEDDNSSGSETAVGTNTVGATATTIATTAVASGYTTLLIAEIAAGGPTNYAGYTLRAIVGNRGGTGSGTTNQVVQMESDANMAAYFERSGTNALLKVLGITNESINWTGTLRTITIANGTATNPQPDNTLIAQWKFTEGSGTTAADSSGNAYTLTNFNGVTWATGKSGSGYAWQFDGTDDYGVSPTITFGTNIITVCAWVYWDSFANDDDLVVESSSNFNSNDKTWAIVPGSSVVSGKAGYGIQDSATTSKYRFETGTRWGAAAWHHLAVVFDNSTTTGDIKVYVDGVEDTLTTDLNTKDQNGSFAAFPIYLFSRGGASAFSDGRIDDLRIYSGELTSTEVGYVQNDPQ